MSRNGSGTYVLPAGQPVTTGTSISSTTFNTLTADIASELTKSIATDGQTPPTANLPMGGFKHTNVANGSARTEYATLGQAQDNTADWLTGVSGTDTITASTSPAFTTYVAGQTFRFTAAGANTGTTVTLNINSVGVKNITKQGATALAIGDIPSGAVCEVVYDGTQFQLINVKSGVTTISAGTTGLTPNTATGGAVTLAGTLNVANGGTGAATIAANNVILGNGTGAVQVVAPGTSGNVLTSSGGTWASATPAASPVKAWCVFDGTLAGTNAPSAGLGVTSITRISAGSYTINLSITMASTAYLVVGSGSGTSAVSCTVIGVRSKTTTSIQIDCGTVGTGGAFPSDRSEIDILVIA